MCDSVIACCDLNINLLNPASHHYSLLTEYIINVNTLTSVDEEACTARAPSSALYNCPCALPDRDLKLLVLSHNRGTTSSG